jgi:hypothetical protein
VVTCDYEEAYTAKEKFDDEILSRWASRAAGDISNVQAPSSNFFTNLRNSGSRRKRLGKNRKSYSCH